VVHSDNFTNLHNDDDDEIAYFWHQLHVTLSSKSLQSTRHIPLFWNG